MTQQVGRGSLKITATETRRGLTATTDTWALSAVDPFGLPADTISITPSATNNGDGTWTFGRPSNGTGDATYYVTASKAGYQSAAIDLTIPQQDAVVRAGPALSNVSLATSGGNATLTYTFTGAATYAKNGTPEGAAADPLVVAQPSAGSAPDSYVLTITGDDGSTLSYPFTVTPVPTSGTTATDLPSCIALANAMHGVLVAQGLMT